MRSKGVSPHDEDALEQFSKLPSVHVSHRTPKQRGKDLEYSLNWLRNKGKDDDVNDATGEFRKLDSVLPKKRGQTPDTAEGKSTRDCRN